MNLLKEPGKESRSPIKVWISLGFCLILLHIVGCSARSNELAKIPTGHPEDTPSSLILDLHPWPVPWLEDNRYQVGQDNWQILTITNTSSITATVPGMLFCSGYQMAFEPPQAIHLIAPDGQDLLQPWERPVEEIIQYENEGIAGYANCGPIVIAPHSRKTYPLTLSQWVHMRQLGEYALWVELVDNDKNLHLSNVLHFYIEEIASSVPANSVHLSLQPQRLALHPTGQIPEYEITFTNNTTRTQVFLVPKQEAFFGCVYPLTQFTVVDDKGRTLPARIGDVCMPSPPDIRAMIVLQPRTSYQMKIRLDTFPDMFGADGHLRSGDYRIQLTYIVWDSLYEAEFMPDFPVDSSLLFVGRLESNKVTLRVK